MVIRPFNYSDTDYKAVVTIHNATFPENQSSLAAWKSADTIREPKYFYQRLIAEKNGDIVGTIAFEEPNWTYKLGKYFIYATVHPTYRRQGIGTALYDSAIEILMPKSPKVFISEAREDQPDGIKFLEKRGFRVMQREPISRLDVPSFDASTFRDALGRFEASGLEIYTLTELQTIDPDCWRKVHELDAVIMSDVPMPEPFTPVDLDQFIKETEDPLRGYDPDGWFIAAVPTETGVGDYVGLSCIWKDTSDAPKFYTGVTGVVREYRRKSIATALKIKGIEYANCIGATVIETNNEENNPMFQLNLDLGFRAVSAFLEYEKQL